MDIGKLFTQAWGLFLKDVGPLIVGALIAGVVPAIAGTVVLAATLGATFLTSTVSAEGEVTSVSVAGWTFLGIGLTLVVVVTVLLTIPLYAGLVNGIIKRVRQDRPMGYGDTFEGFSVFGRVVGASVIIGAIMIALALVPTVLAVVAAAVSSTILGILAGLTGAVAIVAAIYLYTRWVYVIPFIMDQGASATGSLSQSSALVARTGWWTTFLAFFVMTIVISLIGTVLGFIPFVGAIASLLLTPFSLTYVISMYFQAREEDGLIDSALRGAIVRESWPAPEARSGEYPPAPFTVPYIPGAQPQPPAAGETLPPPPEPTAPAPGSEAPQPPLPPAGPEPPEDPRN